MPLMKYIWALQATVCLLWRFRRVLWHGKAYFSDANAEQNGPEFRRLLIESGPFYVKMGQWLSQRPDLLPRAFLKHLKTLQYDAPSHAFEHTMTALRKAFAASSSLTSQGQPVHRDSEEFKSVFLEIEREPLASASIAQVHRVKICLPETGEIVDCVAKVRHPHVKELLDRDLTFVTIMFNLGRLLNVPFTRIVDIDSIVNEMRGQCCLSNEIAPMLEFGANFANSPNVLFPKPMQWCKSEEVVLETRLDGVRYEQLPASTERSSVRDLCKRMTMGAFLHMVFLDGLVHGDCHGGNVLYSVVQRGESGGEKVEEKGEEEEEGGKGEEKEKTKLFVDDEDMYQGALAHEVFDFVAQIAFVDFGVTARITEQQKHAFIEVMNGGFSKDVGRCINTVRHLVIDGNGNKALSASQEAALVEFESEFKVVLEALDRGGQSSVGRMMNELLTLLQRHELRIDGNMVRIMVNFVLIEEDYGYGKFNNVFDNTVRYVLYNDEARDFDALIDPVSDFFANHYAVRHGANAPPMRALVGTDESLQSLEQLRRREIDAAHLVQSQRTDGSSTGAASAASPSASSSSSSSSSSSAGANGGSFVGAAGGRRVIKKSV